MKETSCCLCGPAAPSRERYPARLSPSAVNFEARKLPTGEHFRIVACASCGLVYSNPVFDADRISALYRDAEYRVDDQIECMMQDYLEQFLALLPPLPVTSKILEIGGGHGRFLELLQERGFRDLAGMEPGASAVRQASPAVRPLLRNELFREGSFPDDTFDVACIFQVLDHVPDPDAIVRAMARVLKPGGYLLTVNHDVRALPARVLGEKMPIFDIEHLYLFDPKTYATLFRKNGLEVLRVTAHASRYTVPHLLKMFPFPCSKKEGLLATAHALHLDRVRLKFNGGNMTLAARKPFGTRSCGADRPSP